MKESKTAEVDKMEVDNSAGRPRKATWKEKRIYFLKLLENVLLTGVSQIVTENNTRRKIFKTSVLFICLSGFFYHLASFIVLYLTYPTTLEVLVKFQNESTLPKPIVTICDINGIYRTSFCNAFPEKCEKSNDTDNLCLHYDYFCKQDNETEDDFMFPKFSEYFEADFDRKIIEKCGTKRKDILKLYKNSSEHVIFANEFGKLRNCYSVDLKTFNYENADNDNVHNFYVMQMLQGTPVGNIIVNFNPKESFLPIVPTGAKVSIHSQDQLTNPFIDGFLVKPGMRYVIQLKAIEENLLASPYSTNCTTYKNPKEAAENHESHSRERCLLECSKEKWIKECGCISGEYVFHTNEKFCSTKSEADCINDVNDAECYYKCKVSCKTIFFEYEVDELPLEHTEKLSQSPYLDWYIKKKNVWFSSLNFFFKRPELLIYKYKPQFKLIELFSYIGGYIGIWLGISLIAVCDFLEMLFTYCYHVFKGKVPVYEEKKRESISEIKQDS